LEEIGQQIRIKKERLLLFGYTQSIYGWSYIVIPKVQKKRYRFREGRLRKRRKVKRSFGGNSRKIEMARAANLSSAEKCFGDNF
jgi:hypothetical protein